MLTDQPLTHHATLAGRFYPAEKEFLGKVVDRYLGVVDAAVCQSESIPKAVIAPHSGYINSGPVAAAAFFPWKQMAGSIHRIILLGPSHQYDFPGVALPDAVKFETPLGELSLDQNACEQILRHRFVRIFQAPHENEQSIEVELPFLQRIVPQFEIVPLIVGRADCSQLASLLDELWGGEETVLVISSDLSHRNDYTAAKKIDSATGEAIRNFEAAKINADQACGHRILRAFLKLALKRKMACKMMDLRNSADISGTSADIIGFGAFQFFE